MKKVILLIGVMALFMNSVSAVTVDEIGGFTQAVIQESGVSGQANIKVDNISGIAHVLVLFNTTEENPSLSEIGMDAYRLGLAMEKVLKHYQDIQIYPSIRINPNLNISQYQEKAYLDMSAPTPLFRHG